MYYGRVEEGRETPVEIDDPYENFDNDALRNNCSSLTLRSAYDIEDTIA